MTWLCYVQRCHADVSHVAWPACIEDAEFLILQDGTVELSSVGKSGRQTASVGLSPTLRTFTVRFLAKIGRSLIVQSSRNVEVTEGDVIGRLLTYL